MYLARWLRDKAQAAQRRVHEHCLGLEHLPPNYAFRARFRPGDVVIDVGTGDDPDLSSHLISRYHVQSYAVDPTLKHADALRDIERQLPGFHYLPYALGPESGRVEFHESAVNVSGSVMASHRNVLNDPTVSYAVDMVGLADLLDIIGHPEVALMKIDIEGAEYDLVKSLDLRLLRRIRQLIIEFHHDIVAEFTWSDTKKAIDGIRGSGMKALVYNGRDCLFYW